MGPVERSTVLRPFLAFAVAAGDLSAAHGSDPFIAGLLGLGWLTRMVIHHVSNSSVLLTMCPHGTWERQLNLYSRGIDLKRLFVEPNLAKLGCATFSAVNVRDVLRHQCDSKQFRIDIRAISNQAMMKHFPSDLSRVSASNQQPAVFAGSPGQFLTAAEGHPRADLSACKPEGVNFLGCLGCHGSSVVSQPAIYSLPRPFSIY